MNKKYLIIFVIVSFLVLVGCQSKKDLTIYEIDSDYLYQSTEDAYDYSFALNEHWTLIKNNGNGMIFGNNKNDLKIFIVKNTENLDKLQQSNVQAKEYPSLVYHEFQKVDINFDKIDIDKSKVDYENSMKFYHEYGRINEKYIQIISFISNYSIPSVSGGKAINAVAIVYDNADDQNDIENFLMNFEQNIQYE